jgi:hypothetical protein
LTTSKFSFLEVLIMLRQTGAVWSFTRYLRVYNLTMSI